MLALAILARAQNPRRVARFAWVAALSSVACGEASTPAPEPAGPDPWSSEDTPGAEIFSSCASCHMADAGGRPDGSVPRLAGQRAEVLTARLDALRDGTVDLPVMAAFARSLDAVEVDAVAVWLSVLPPPSDIGVGPGDDLRRGQALFAERCASCHGIEGEGAPGTPLICGQHNGYVLRRLDEIAGQRRADAHPAMAAVVAAMSATERAAVADFLSRGACAAPAPP